MENFLKQLGFAYFTGNLWKHEVFGIMQFEENTNRILREKNMNNN